ncbi:uncharacterized protein [Montipora capricornis]|uniref:uncharacterized protein n=1 Tax=Montipora capricornis TaxID=246305 RepID=UPI0035F19BA8
MSTTSRQSMNYITPPSPLTKSSGSLRSYNSNSCFPLTNGEVHLNSAYDYAESDFGSLKLEHDYEDLKSVRTEAKAMSGPRKKANDLYESTHSVPYRKRQITECSDDSSTSSISTAESMPPVTRDSCLSKLILFLILAFSVAALVLVILIISGKIGPKCSCIEGNKVTTGNEDIHDPSTEASVSVQSLMVMIQNLENNLTAMTEKMKARERAVYILVRKHEKQVEILQAHVFAQGRIINETANKVVVADGVWINMTRTHKAFESKLQSEFKVINKSVRALRDRDGYLTARVNELRVNQTLAERMRKRFAENVTQLESRVQELKKSSINMSSRAGSLERRYVRMNSSMKTLEMVNDAQNASYTYLQSLYNNLRGSLANVNSTFYKPRQSTGFDKCSHHQINGTPVTVGSTAYALYKEPSNTKAMGITCSTDYAQHFKLSLTSNSGYQCECNGKSPIFGENKITCFLHVWECLL